MKNRILIVLLCFITITVYSQNVSEEDVPAAFIENFNKKFTRAIDVMWYTIHKKNFRADFFMDEKQIKAEFSPKGEWIESREMIDPKSVYRPIENFINMEFPGSKFIYGEKIIRADKQDSYYTQIEEKIKGVKNMPPTELFFDKTGRFEKIVKPEIPEDPSETAIEEDDDHEDDFDKIVEAEIKEQKKTKKKKKKDEDDNGFYERQKVDPRSLPTPIMNYVMDNFYKLVEYKIASAEYLENEELGLHYYLIVKKEGLNQPESELFFTITGDFIRRIDPPELVEQLEAKQEKESEKIAERKEKTTKQVEDIPEVIAPAVDVPENVTSYFSRRFPRAEEVVWEEYGDKNYMASFWFRDVRTKTEFTPEGVLISTITEMDPKNVYAPVARYLEQNYPDYKVDIGEKAVRKDRNNYYYVLIYTTKKKVSPKEIELYFDKIGRYMDEPPEFLNQ